MSTIIFRVQWFECNGEECEEEFSNKVDAENFVAYNEWDKGVHPKIKKYERDADGTERLV